MEKAPDLPEIRVNLALAYRHLSRVADAVTQLEKAASLAPDQASVLFQLGGAYVEMNELDKAAAALEKGLAAQPNLTDALAYEATATLGAVYFAQGRNDAAIARFERALAERPEATTAKLGLGKALFSRGGHATRESGLARSRPGVGAVSAGWGLRRDERSGQGGCRP